MKVRCSFKSTYSDDINSQFESETDTVKVSEISTEVYNLMSRSSLISSWNPLNQLGPRVLVSKETLVLRRSKSETLNFVIKRVVIVLFFLFFWLETCGGCCFCFFSFRAP